MNTEKFQNIVLGGGEAGKYIAWELARSGQRVAVVERGLIGGSCPNIACLPSKNMIRSAKAVEIVRHAAVQAAMLSGLPYTGLRDAILTHPTMAEGLGALLAGVPAMTQPRA